MRFAHLVLSALLITAAVPAIAQPDPSTQQFQLGEKALQNNDFGTAEQAFNKALGGFRARNDIAGQRKALFQLGTVYYRLEQYQRSLMLLQQAIAYAKTSQEQGEILSLRGWVQLELGEYQQAYTSLFQAQGRQLKDPSAEARTRIGLGEAYRHLGLYSKAIETLMLAKNFSAIPADRGRAINAIAEVQFALGQYDEAQKNYQDALVIRRSAGDRIGSGQTLRNLGRVTLVLGNPTGAMQFYQQALIELKSIAKYSEQVAVLNDLGKLYLQQGKIDQAKDALENAFGISRLANGAGRVQTLINLGTLYRHTNQGKQAIEALEQALALARRNGDRLAESRALSELGETRLKFKQSSEAVNLLQSSINLFETFRPGLRDADKVSLFETHAQTYRHLQTALIQEKQPESALAIAERSRARAFVELLATRLSNFQAIEKPPALKDIQAAAKEKKATLVTYSIAYGDDEQESALYIWVVQPTGNVTFRQVNLQRLQQDNNVSLSEIAQKSRQVASTGEDYTPTQLDGVIVAMRGKFRAASTKATHSAPVLASVQSAYQLLIQPIADVLPKDPNAHVVFIPQDALFTVPFAALQDASGKFLIEKHTITVAPSIQALSLSKARPGLNASNALVIGNPTPMPQKLSPLPGAEAEAKAIAQLLNTKPMIGAQATKAAVLDRISKASVIHFATHGLLDEYQALQSSLALAGKGNDALLTADEILNLRLKADLAVLSACDTGHGRITGDGVIGLSRSLMSAGVPSVVVSLWMVPDEATAVLMKEFYRNLQKDSDKARSLRQAMLTTMKQFPNPRDWAGFMLVGRAD